jgi:hypothetical protein
MRTSETPSPTPRITHGQSLNPCLNARTSSDILQPVDLLGEMFSFANFNHCSIVAYWIHIVNVILSKMTMTTEKISRSAAIGCSGLPDNHYDLTLNRTVPIFSRRCMFYYFNKHDFSLACHLTTRISGAAPPRPLEYLCWVNYSKSRAIGHRSSDGETGVPAPLIRHLFLFRDNMGEACG